METHIDNSVPGFYMQVSLDENRQYVSFVKFCWKKQKLRSVPNQITQREIEKDLTQSYDKSAINSRT